MTNKELLNSLPYLGQIKGDLKAKRKSAQNLLASIDRNEETVRCLSRVRKSAIYKGVALYIRERLS